IPPSTQPPDSERNGGIRPDKSRGHSALRAGGQLRAWPLQLARTLLHCLLHLLEGADLDLADPLAADAEFGRELLQRDRILGQPARLEDAPFAVVEDVHGFAEEL